jgi:ribosome-associated translation inhibitor RaiA
MNETTPQPEDVIISGFQKEEKVFSESVREECSAFLSKLRRETDVRSLELRMKYSQHGKSRLFDVRATARLPDSGALHAQASARELNLAIRRAFAELAAQGSRISSYKSGIRSKEKR